MKVEKIPASAMKLLPPRPGYCQECAVKHEPNQPHNKQSLYYQYKFYADNGRWPNWIDAMAHCGNEMQRAWMEELMKKGVNVDK